MFNILIFVMVIFIAIAKLPLWSIVNPWVNVNLHRLLSLFTLSWVDTNIDISQLSIFISRFLRLVCLLILVIKNNTIRQRGFWLASLPILGILLLDGISRYWSISSIFSESRFLYISAVVVGGFYIGLEFKLSNIFKLFEGFSVFIVLGTFYAVIKQPGFAIMTEGPWIGFFWWKSYLGEMSAFAATMFFFRWADYKNNRWFVTLYAFVFYLLSIYILFKSDSATQLIALFSVHFVALLASSYLKWGHGFKTKHWLVFSGISLVILILVWVGRETILGFLGRNASLTGRIPVWTALVPYIQQRLILGYGFGEAFWKDPFYRLAVARAAGNNVPFAHNGFIEVLLGTGITGLVLWITFLVEISYMSIKYILWERSVYSLIFLSWVVYTVVANLADNMLGSYEYFTVLLLVIAFSCLIRDRLERKKAQLADPVADN